MKSPRSRVGALRGLLALMLAMLASSPAALADWSRFNDWLRPFTVQNVPKMVIDFTDLPPEVAAIEITLVFRVALGDVFETGIMEIHDFTCSGLQLEDISMSSSRDAENTLITTALRMKSLDGQCAGRILTKGIKLKLLKGLLPGIPDADFAFTLEKGKGGISLDLGFETKSEDFLLHPPNVFNVTTCAFELPSNMIVLDDPVAQIILPVLTNTLEGIACQIMQQLGLLKDGSPGIFTSMLNDLNAAIAESTQAVAVDVPAAEAAVDADLSANNVNIDDIVIFRDNELFDFVSVMLNDVLGGSGSGDESGEVLINEFIRTALESMGHTGGSLELDLAQDLTVADLDVGRTDLTVGKLTITGLDSFSEFEMFANPDKYKYTLSHSLNIAQLEAKVEMGVVVTPGPQIMIGSNQQLRIDFDVSVGFEGIRMGAATLVAIDMKNAMETQVGQLLGDGASHAIDCALNSLKAFVLADLSLGVDTVRSPQLSSRGSNGIDRGLADLFNGVVDLGMLSFKSSLDKFLPVIAKGTLRDMANEAFRDFAGDMFKKRTCPAYQQVAKTAAPTHAPIPAGTPTKSPTSKRPTKAPSRRPTASPTLRPTWKPTGLPTAYKAKTDDDCKWDRVASVCEPTSNCYYCDTCGHFSHDGNCRINPNATRRALGSLADYLKFDTPYLDDVRDVLEKTIYKTSDPNVGINSIIRTVTEHMSPGKTSPGSVLFPGDLAKVDLKKDDDGIDMFLRVSDLRLTGLDTVGSIDLMQATGDPYTINNTIAFGAGGRPTQLSIDIELRGSIFSDPKATEKFTLSFSVSEMQIILAIMMRIDVDKAMEKTFGDMFQMSCLMTLLPPEFGMRLRSMIFDAASYAVVFDCGEDCKMLRMDVVNQYMRSAAGSKQLVADVNSMFNEVGKFVVDNDGIGEATDQFVSDVASQCNAPPSEPEGPVETRAEATKRAQAAFVVSVLLFSTLLIILIVAVVRVLNSKVKTHRKRAKTFKAKYASEQLTAYTAEHLARGRGAAAPSTDVVDSGMLYSSRAESDWSEVFDNPMSQNSSSEDESSGRKILQGRRKSDQFEDRIHPDLRCSLSNHPRVTQLWRVVVPVCLVLNLCLFLSANLGIGASVDLYAKVREGGEIEVQNLFIFTLAGSIVDMWTAGVWSLALIIALASGAWPYIKLIMLGYCWFCPPTVLNSRRRGRLLSILDILGKWSVIDQFIMVMLMVVFRFVFDLPPEGADISYLPPVGFMYLEVRINPQWGFYGFFMAALGSLVVNHFIVIQHRNVVSVGWFSMPTADSPESGRRTESTLSTTGRSRRLSSSWWNSGTDDVSKSRRTDAVKKAALCDHVYECYGKDYRLKFTSRFKWFIVGSTFVTFFIMMAGYGLLSFGYQFKGLGAMAFREVKPGSDRIELSLFSLLSTLGDQATDEFMQAFGIYFLLGVFASCVILIPISQVFLTMALWLVPLTLKQQKILFYVNDILSAWAGLEVFVAAIIASALNIERFAGFMVGGGCKDVDRILRDFAVPMGLVEEGEATCFSVTAFFDNPGFLILCLAVLASVFLGQFVHRTCEQAMVDREYRIKGTLYAGGAEDTTNAAEDAMASKNTCFCITIWLQRIFLCDGCDSMNHSFPLAVGAMNLIPKDGSNGERDVELQMSSMKGMASPPQQQFSAVERLIEKDKEIERLRQQIKVHENAKPRA